MCTTLLDSRGRLIPPSDENWPIARMAMKDIQEIAFIHEILGDRLLDGDFRDCLNLMLQDSTSPDGRSTQTPGRDAQWELLLAAIAVRSGMEVSRFGDALPDWDVRCGKQRWAIEAKRCKEWDSIEPRIRKAGSQIQKSQIPGVILLDMSFGDGGTLGQLPYGTSETELDKAFERAGDHYAGKLLPQIHEWLVSKPSVGAIGIHQSTPVCRGGSG